MGEDPIIIEAHRLIGRATARLINDDHSKPMTPERARLVETVEMLRQAMGLLRPDEAHPEDATQHHRDRAALAEAG